mgnify:FL=1
MNLRQVLVQTVIGLIAILIAVLYAMFIVPQDWFIDSRESVVTISVIICATGYIITVWARYIRHLTRRRIDQRIIRDAESEMETVLWQKPKILRNEPTATIRLDRKHIRQSQRKSR